MLSLQRGAHVKKPSTAFEREHDFHVSEQISVFLTIEKCSKVCEITFALCGFPFWVLFAPIVFLKFCSFSLTLQACGAPFEIDALA